MTKVTISLPRDGNPLKSEDDAGKSSPALKKHELPNVSDRAVDRMIETICKHASQIGHSLQRQTLDAVAHVDRRDFVLKEFEPEAYGDHPLPIGHGQTISQPFMVALMTDLLNLQPSSTVLEVGSGCGYQTAILAKLSARVFAIEIVPALATKAKRTLERTGFTNTTVKSGDGFDGWPDKAPFDGIVVAAASVDIPQPLVAQLRPGGKLIMPIGSRDSAQVLRLLTKNMDEGVCSRDILPVRFVPLIRGR